MELPKLYSIHRARIDWVLKELEFWKLERLQYGFLS